MGEYRRLTQAERYQIEALFRSGQGVRGISRILGRSASTVSRELSRYRDHVSGQYFPHPAHQRALQIRKRPRPERCRVRGDLESLVAHALRQDLSPEQISGRLRWIERDLGWQVAPSTIYRFVYWDALWRGGTLYRHLRSCRKARVPRRKRPFPELLEGRLSNQRRSIAERPQRVLARKRLGDYERDTVHGQGVDQSRHVLLTLIDRRSRYLRLALLPKKSARAAHLATLRLLRNEDHPVHTITNDNGPEFADHELTARKLGPGTRIYFCHPARSWERGTNENANGLLRQYFPRNLSFRTIGAPKIREVEKRLNSRPRKCLGYRTPEEVHRGIDRRLLRWS